MICGIITFAFVSSGWAYLFLCGIQRASLIKLDSFENYELRGPQPLVLTNEKGVDTLAGIKKRGKFGRTPLRDSGKHCLFYMLEQARNITF